MEDTTTSKLDARPILAAVALAFVAAAIWAATTFAGGGSSVSEPIAGSEPGAPFFSVQDAPSDDGGLRGDCPEDEVDGASGGGSSESDASGSSPAV